MNFRKDALDIIIVDGQSNAEGNGRSLDDYVETMNDVYELVDSNSYGFCFDNPENPTLRLTMPVECKIQCLQERISNSSPASHLSMTFVDEYIKHGLLKEGRRILVIKSAFGGTGFARKQQGVNDVLHQRTIGMIDYALDGNPENRIVAYLWHQGEHDAFENKDQPLEQKYNFYHDAFIAKMNDIRNRYSKFQFPIISGEFCNDWADRPENKKSTEVIEKCLCNCMDELELAGMVSSEGLTSNNQEFGDGDDSHFSKKSLLELGRRYFQEYWKIINK